MKSTVALLALCCLQAATIWAKSLAGNYMSSSFCAKQSDGQIYCWGWNHNGMFGIGSPVGNYHTVPVQMQNVVSASDVDMGISFACIVDQGQVKCAGYENYIKRNSATELSNILLSIEGVDANTTASQVFLGNRHACLLTDLGLVWCWGDGSRGQLANPFKHMYETALRITGYGSSSKMVEVALGEWHTCILLSDSTVGCTGANSWGQLGTGTWVNSDQMLQVQGGLSNVVSISAGEYHTCAVTRNGKLLCWGSQSRNQFAMGFSNYPQVLPLVVRGVPRAVSVTCNRDATFVLSQSDRSLVGLGRSKYGALVLGTTRALKRPTKLYGGQRRIREVAGSDSAVCILLDNGQIKCIGNNKYGQLGRGLPVHNELEELGLVAGLPLTQAPTPKPTKRPTQYPTSKYPTAKPTKRPTQYPTKKMG